jgi:hypothetical protein
MNDAIPTPVLMGEFWEEWTPSDSVREPAAAPELALELSPESASDSEAGSAVAKPPRRRWLRIIGRAIASAIEWMFGAFALFVGLSLLAAIPIFQFLSFGYLLEAGGRVARTGRLRNALIGVRKAARVGQIVIGCWLVLLPLRLVSSWAASAQVIDPGGVIAKRWRWGLLALAVVTALHLIAACARGGTILHFLWPFTHPFWLVKRIRRGGFYAASRDAVWDFVASLSLPHYFRLGFFGFLGTMVWLFVPVSLLAVGRRWPLLGFLGAILLGVVTMVLPFLQMRFASENRLRALFEYRAIRTRFVHAPWAFAIALLVALASAIPLYLLKIEMIPRETAWLPSLLFVGFIYPARVLTGWAYGLSARRERPRHWFFRWTGRFALLPVAAFYVMIVFFTQFTAWQGVWSLYEQHAFLLPVPFLNM